MNNTTKDLISVIVPVYNVSEYLEKCINSILCQTYTNLEIILIDDGSTDNSGEICDQYAKKDNRINIIHKKNGGLSSARNCGLKIAAGVYIGFVDSDDYIEPDMYETLYFNMVNQSADLSMCGYFHTYSNYEKANSITTDKQYTTNAKDALEILLKEKTSTIMACNKLYKKEIFSSLIFPIGKTMEDAYIIVEILSNSKTIVIDTCPKYHYVHRENSITSSPFTTSTMDIINAYMHILEQIRKGYPGLNDIAEERLVWANFLVLDKMIMSDIYNNETYKISKYIINNTKKILKSHFFNNKRKIGVCVLFCSYRAYKCLVHMQNNKKI